MEYEPTAGLRPPGMKHSIYGALVVPRPIGWITTMSTEGVVNLAPYSFFNAVSADPMCVMYCANGSHVEGGGKDSLENVRETGEFVTNLVTADLAKPMNDSSISAPRSVDEMALVGLDPQPSLKVKPPRVGAAPIHLECELDRIVELPSSDTTLNRMVIGRVVQVHISDEVIVDGMVDWGRLRPLARLGYLDYAEISEPFSLDRPD
ncbi:MAG: flavin reductase family protein [Acidimicrobiales bacterium]